jgi:hypothetical protein
MERKTIELGGICRNLPDNTVKDGLMHELINLRPKDGALRPIGMKDRVDLPIRNVRFIHAINETKKVYFGVSTSSPAVLSYLVIVPTYVTITLAGTSCEADIVFFWITKRATFATDETMLLGRSQCSCKYFIVVFGGHQEADAYFNYLTIDSEDRYQTN